MSGIAALLALATAGAIGIRQLVLSKRRAASELVPVNPADADREITIVDNGGTPFVVRLSYKRRMATVYRVLYKDGNNDTTSDIIRSFRYERAFVGLDPTERETFTPFPLPGVQLETETKKRKQKRDVAIPANLEPRRWWHGGNTVLLDLGKRRYVFIGLVIASFTASDDIVDYVSTMGNSAVPYPFAVGTVNTYFLIETTYIPNHIIKMFRCSTKYPDLYRVLYDDDLRRWMPGADPRERREKISPEFSGNHLRDWKGAFPLQDYEILVDRQW